MESDPIGLAAGPNTYSYVENMPTMYVDRFGLKRKPGRTPPGLWPPLPGNIGGKKPKWDSEGFYKGKGGGKFTWDDRSHGSGIDRGAGEQGGHWDDENSDNRYDENGNPGNVPTSRPQALDEAGIARTRDDFAQAARNAREAGLDGV